MGNIEFTTNDNEYYMTEPYITQGSASTTNTSVIDETPKNPIGFIWPDETKTTA